MKKIRKTNESLQDYLDELVIGGDSVYDEVTNYEITKTVGGYIYKNEYVGMVFVPDINEIAKKIKDIFVKAEPKRTVTK